MGFRKVPPYVSTVMKQLRQEDNLSIKEIQEIVLKEYGINVAQSTVQYHSDEKFRRYHRDYYKEYNKYRNQSAVRFAATKVCPYCGALKTEQTCWCCLNKEEGEPLRM